MSESKGATVTEPNIVQIPEWEHAGVNKGSDVPAPAASSSPRRRARAGFGAKLDRILPPHKRYLRMSRSVFLLVLLAVILVLIALIIGLAVGLTKRNSASQNLPLPTNQDAHTGQLTYYGVGEGACGWTNGDADDIVSLSHFLFDSQSTGSNPNDNPLCGRYVRAARYDEQVGAKRSVDLKVVDRCTGCQPNDLDTSLGAFEKLAPSASGRVDVSWAWLPPSATKA